jgi:CMP-N-acetylneuraminic acid synthetase
VRVAAFVPARGGSKRVPEKNLAYVRHETLLGRAIRAGLGAGCSVVVSTDDRDIAAAARSWPSPERGVDLCRRGEIVVHDRPAQLASDHAQIEDALSHWWRRLETKPDVIVLLQPTSPFRTSEHVKAAVRLLRHAELDSVVGVVQSHAPHFSGRMKPMEYLHSDAWFIGLAAPSGEYYEWQPFAPQGERPRTQDLPPRGWECGALYAFTRAHWEKTGSRMGGDMGALPMTWIEGLDIDTPEDLEAARAIAEGMGL